MSSNLGSVVLLVALGAFAAMILFPVAFGYATLGLLVAACLAAVAMVVYVIYWLVRNRVSPVIRVRATVLRKRGKDWDVTIPLGESPEMGIACLGLMGRDPKGAAEAFNKMAAHEDGPEVEVASGTDCYVTFAFDDREAEFAVPMEVFTRVEQGTEGLLVFRGEEFERFITGV